MTYIRLMHVTLQLRLDIPGVLSFRNRHNTFNDHFTELCLIMYQRL